MAKENKEIKQYLANMTLEKSRMLLFINQDADLLVVLPHLLYPEGDHLIEHVQKVKDIRTNKLGLAEPYSRFPLSSPHISTLELFGEISFFQFAPLSLSLTFEKDPIAGC